MSLPTPSRISSRQDRWTADDISLANHAAEEPGAFLDRRAPERDLDQRRRIDEGEYGYCAVTGEPISLARLQARPIATMTLEAQERHERREKVHRDD